jgi:exonuclease III
MANNCIIQWNCRGLKPNFNELRIMADNHNPIVFCLQETFLNSVNFNIRGFNSYHHLSTDIGGRACGGVSVLVKEGIPHSEVTINTPLQAKAVTVSAAEVMTVCSLYLPPSERLNVNHLLLLINQLPSPFIICGDFNGHHVSWGCVDNNRRGNLIDKFIVDNNICLLNSGSSTYLHPGSGSFSAIDLTLCSPSLVLDLSFSVEADMHGSDHFPIIVECGGSLPDGLPRWNFGRADWAGFQDACLERLTLEAVDMYEDPMEGFTTIFCDIAGENIPRTTTKVKKRCKSWFNKECEDAIKAREKALAVFSINITADNLSLFKIARAKARRIIRSAKSNSWKQYVSKLNSKTNIKSTWDMVRRISGKHNPSRVYHLTSNNVKITESADICNVLAESFAFNSSADNYSPTFNTFRKIAEKKKLNFNSNNAECYNEYFTLHELQNALHRSNDTSPGDDTVHYQLLKHMPEETLGLLLDIFNFIWVHHLFPKAWKTAIIIPIPKPGKDLTNPKSYRPIALTSCICKTFERMINDRLVWYLERNNILSKYQSGFRKQRSTVDHLVKLETSIRDAFINKRHIVTVFFDLEKAYDTTWKYGIMQDLHKAGLRGRLPTFVSNFLSDRVFKVRVGNTYSNLFTQEMGVPQGSILSVTLFSLKINSIVSCIKPDIECSLYVDDLAVSYSSFHMHTIERKLQQCLNSLQTWCDANGFKFSPTKTVCVHFCRQRKLHLDPELYLNRISSSW